MSWSKEIGGYLELELNDNDTIYHDAAKALNSGRHALEFILLQKKYRRVLVPYYGCEAILQPIKRQNIDFEFYPLNADFTPSIRGLKSGEALLYINYFGLMTPVIKALRLKPGNLIVDNSQAFYDTPIDGVPTFYSPHKFFGVPDGGFAYVEQVKAIDLETDCSGGRIAHLIRRMEGSAQEGYPDFRTNEERLNQLPMRKISVLTKRLLKNIDFDKVEKRRLLNFKALHRTLNPLNELTPLIDLADYTAPMAYPFLRKGNDELRRHLINHKIYLPTYWPNVKAWTPSEQTREVHLQEHLLPLPIDQRYVEADMETIATIVKKIAGR